MLNKIRLMFLFCEIALYMIYKQESSLPVENNKMYISLPNNERFIDDKIYY